MSLDAEFSFDDLSFEPLLFDENPVQDNSMQELIAGLNEPQREAVLHTEGPLLVLAGAGSGKTRVITVRIAYMIKQLGISPYAILAITFTNKAAGEMKQRIADLVGPVADSMWLGTFHSMFARLLRYHAELLGYTSSYNILDTSDCQSLVKRIVAEMGLSDKRYEPRAVLAYVSACKNSLLPPGKSGQDDYLDKMPTIYARYQQALKSDNCMDFDDILVNTYELLRKHPEVLEKYQERFRYIMVDEYQDTNTVQYKIVNLLGAKHKNVCVVGDDDQSIYAFRGADIKNILNFEKEYKGCKLIKLEQNYRSTENILRAANELIANNKSRKEKKLWTSSGEGEKIFFIRAANHFDEGRYIAMQIRKEMALHADLKYSDFAVLYRANALSRYLEGSLREDGIPYKIYGGLRFYDRKEIKDVLAYLRLVVTDRDSVSFVRAVQNPRRGIGDTTIDALRAESERSGETMLALCLKADEYPALSRAAEKLYRFAVTIMNMRATLEASTLSLSEFVGYVQEESGILQALLDEKDKGKEDAVDRIENMKELLSDAVEFADTSLALPLALDVETSETAEAALPKTWALSRQLHEFLQRAALYSEQDLDNEGEGFVHLMTIHASKGLEFKQLFLVAAENGIFPSSRSLQEEQGLEEERRLAYVAVTRARERLYITTARSRTLYGQTQSFPVSCFAKEIPQKYMKLFGANNPTKPLPQINELQLQPSKGLDEAALSFLKSGVVEVEAAVQAADNAAYLAPGDLAVGLRVTSQRYGAGEILKFERTAGDAIIEVRFDMNEKAKRLMLKQAKLTAVR